MAANNKVKFSHNDEGLRASAIFCAELIRQGVTFEANAEKWGERSEDIEVTLTGGY